MNQTTGDTMKAMKMTVLVLGLCLLAAARARAGIFDLYGGFATFADEKAGDRANLYSPPSSTNRTGVFTPIDYSGTKILNSFDGGFRVGSLTQAKHFNYSFAFDMDFYGVGAVPGGSNVFAANAAGVTKSTYWNDTEGGLVMQPGVQFLLGIPLRYFRVYAGYGIIMPVMFYNYTSYDQTSNTLNAGALGTSAALGQEFLIGFRWLITNHLSLFVENRTQSLFTSMAIKDSYYSPSSNTFVDRTFTFDNLTANKTLIGMGYSWGG